MKLAGSLCVNLLQFWRCGIFLRGLYLLVHLVDFEAARSELMLEPSVYLPHKSVANAAQRNCCLCMYIL